MNILFQFFFLYQLLSQQNLLLKKSNAFIPKNFDMHTNYDYKLTNPSYNSIKNELSTMNKYSKPQIYPSKLTYSNPNTYEQNFDNKREYAKQNQYNAKILDYMTKSNEYQHHLRMNNLSLNSTISSLLTHKLSAQQQQQHLKQQMTADNLQIMDTLYLQSSQLQQSSFMIHNLIKNKQLLNSQIQKLGYQLNQQYEKGDLQRKQMKVRLQQLDLQTNNIVNNRNRKIYELENRIKMYDREKQQSQREKQKYKLAILQHKLQEQKWRKQQNSRKSMKYCQQEMFASKQHILSLQRQLGKLKNEKKFLNQQIFQLKDIIQQSKQHQNTNKAPQNSLSLANTNLNTKDKKTKQDIQREIQQVHGMLTSMVTLRNGINREIMEIFTKSVSLAQKNKTNSFKIFIQKWRTMEIQRIQPYIKTYISLRQSLLQFYRQFLTHPHPLPQKIISSLKTALAIDLLTQQSSLLPHHLAIKAPGVYKTHASIARKKKLENRDQGNLWVIEKMEFIVRQREEKIGKENWGKLDGELGYLFRLLAIQQKITYPKKGEKCRINGDVRNCLRDRIIQAVWNVIKCM